MMILSDLSFDKELCYKAQVARRKQGDDGYYVPILNKHMGENGEWLDHPLKGQRVTCDSNGESYIVDSVNIHFYNGYYYLIILINEKTGSSTSINKVLSGNPFGDTFTNKNVFRTAESVNIKLLLEGFN